MPFSGPLEDRELIRELLDDYCDAVNRRDAVAWGATWDEDSTWSLPALGIEDIKGRANIVANWKQAMGLFSFANMITQAGSIAVDGERATVRSYTSEVLVTVDGGKEQRPRGLYEDICVKRGGRWLFQSRTFHVLHGV